MAKRQKPDPHFSSWGPEYDIDIGFGGMDNKYSSASIPEGIEMLKGDIADLAKKYWESTQMEEGEKGKLPPLPTSWAQGILRALINPARGTLYEAVKKNPLGVSMFKTIAGDASRRQFLLNMIGKTKSFEKAQFLEMLKKSAEKVRKNPGFKFKKFDSKKILKEMKEHLHRHYKRADDKPGIGHNKPPESILKANGKSKLKDWDITGKTKHAEGGLAGMLGEPRSGYQGGGGTGYQDKWKTVRILQQKLGEYNPEVLELSPNSFLDFLKKNGYYGYKKGGRIGLAEGDTPSQAWMRDYFYSSGYDDIGVITLDDYINGGQG